MCQWMILGAAVSLRQILPVPSHPAHFSDSEVLTGSGTGQGWGAMLDQLSLFSSLVSCVVVVDSAQTPHRPPSLIFGSLNPPSLLCDLNHRVRPTSAPLRARPKTTLLLCLNHTSCCVYVRASVSVCVCAK